MISKVAAQLFTLREHTKTASDFAKTLKKVSDIGYRAVQVSAIDCMNGDNPEVDAKTAAKMLADNGLRCIATHRGTHQFINDVEKEIAFHQELGCTYTAIGSLGSYKAKGTDGYLQFIKDIKPAVDKLNAAGITFGYHNHSYEFEASTMDDRKTNYDILIEDAPFMSLEIDFYWCVHAGVDPVWLIERTAGRLQVIHLKDKEVHPEEGPIIAAVGEGNMNWHAIIPALEKAGTEWYAVEQDHCLRDPFDCLKSSYDYLSGLTF